MQSFRLLLHRFYNQIIMHHNSTTPPSPRSSTLLNHKEMKPESQISTRGVHFGGIYIYIYIFHRYHYDRWYGLAIFLTYLAERADMFLFPSMNTTCHFVCQYSVLYPIFKSCSIITQDIYITRCLLVAQFARDQCYVRSFAGMYLLNKLNLGQIRQIWSAQYTLKKNILVSDSAAIVTHTNILGFGGMLLLFFDLFFTLIEHTYNIYIYYSSSTTLDLLIASARQRGPPLECRAEIRTRACLTASRRATV